MKKVIKIKRGITGSIVLFTILVLSQMTFAQFGRVSDSADLPTVSASEKSDEKIDCESVDTSEEYKYIISKGIKSFAEKLNAAAKCGYKLEKITKFPLFAGEKFDQLKLAGVLKSDLPNRYEYDWFEAFTPGEVVTRINYRVQKGFYFHDVLPLAEGLCDNNQRNSSDRSDTEKILDNLIDSLSFSLGDIYFLERQEKTEIQPEYRMLVGAVGWGKTPTADLQKSLDDAVEQGFRPVSMSSYKVGRKYGLSVLVEKKGEIIPNDPLPQYQVIRSEFGFEKKVNNYARQGFKLVLAGEMWAFRHALMLKDNEKSGPLSYKWLGTWKKSYPGKFTNLTTGNTDYKAVSSRVYGCDYSENQLIFEQRITGYRNETDLKVLNLTDKWERKISLGEKIDDFLSPSEERAKEFQTLLNAGYTIRDLFYADGVNVVLEQQKRVKD